jgi:hypothetical protein
MVDGITLLIGAFFFYSLARPETIKNRTQFMGVFGILVAIVGCYTLHLMLYNSSAGKLFTAVVIGVLQLVGLVLSVMYVGGLSARDVGAQVVSAAKSVRNNEPMHNSAPMPASAINTSTETSSETFSETHAQKPVEQPVKRAPALADEPTLKPRIVIELPRKDA